MLVSFAISIIAAGDVYSQGLTLEKVGTEHAYFSYQGKPLLSYGPMSDFIFYASEDAYDYKTWADWQATHGMNHCRAYLPGSWVHIEQVTEENGGSLDQVLFPFLETEPGSRQFDLTRFDERYWQRFRKQCRYLQSKGIILDLLMFNGWQLWNYNSEVAKKNWDGHFFNPKNNINACTDHLNTDKNKNNRLKFYHSITDGRTELFNIQAAYFDKIIQATYDLDNIYYELVHELAMNYSDWPKTSQWLEAMALSVRNRWKSLNPDRSIILATDAGHLAGFPFNQGGGYPEPDSEMDWVFSRPYFDVMIYGNQHHTSNAREWPRKYKKPYVAQESRDDTGHSWSYRIPEMRTHLRKYIWKMMMVKCQQLDIYAKGARQWFPAEDKPGWPLNYDPNGWNPFENDALLLRDFFDHIISYEDLTFKGHFFISPLGHNLVLSSPREIIAYISSPTGFEAYEYTAPVQIRLADLPFADGLYTANFFDPKTGPSGSRKVSIKAGRAIFGAPGFIDDYVIHIINPHHRQRDVLPNITQLPSHPDQLPLMQMIDGTPLSTLEDWETKRKPELKQALQHYTYGYLPPAYSLQTTEIKSRNDAFDGVAAYKEVQIDIPLPSGNTETIYLALFIPNSIAAKKPVIIYLSGQANHMSTTYDQVTVRTYGGKFPSTRGTWQANYVANIEYALTRGYAVAHFCTEDLDPDIDNDTEDGLYRLLAQYVPGPFDHRLRQQIAWAWGAHRIVDYLVTRQDIDIDKIAVNGFSRRGRASSVASALDERIDLCWNHAGGGTHNWRDGKIYDSGYMYWFNDYHMKFIGHEDLVPFDGNAMIALHAPRPFLDTGGDHPGVPGESYATYDCHDHASAFGEMQNAASIYKLYGNTVGIVGAATGSFVPTDYKGKLYQVVDTNKGHFQDIEFWKHGLDFMDLQFYGKCSDPYTTYVYEAENAIKSGCSTSNDNMHYYGPGYVSDFKSHGDSIEFVSVNPGGGTHYIGIRAACGSMTNPPEISIAVNNEIVIDHHTLGCWTDELWFMDYRVKAAFVPGLNTVRLTKQDTGNLYIDRIVIYKNNANIVPPSTGGGWYQEAAPPGS